MGVSDWAAVAQLALAALTWLGFGPKAVWNQATSSKERRVIATALATTGIITLVYPHWAWEAPNLAAQPLSSPPPVASSRPVAVPAPSIRVATDKPTTRIE